MTNENDKVKSYRTGEGRAYAELSAEERTALNNKKRSRKVRDIINSDAAKAAYLIDIEVNVEEFRKLAERSIMKHFSVPPGLVGSVDDRSAYECIRDLRDISVVINSSGHLPNDFEFGDLSKKFETDDEFNAFVWSFLYEGGRPPDGSAIASIVQPDGPGSEMFLVVRENGGPESRRDFRVDENVRLKLKKVGIINAYLYQAKTFRRKE